MRINTEVCPPFIKHDADFLDAIAYTVCHVCGVNQSILKSDLKHRKYSIPRNLYIHFACLYTHVSQEKIGFTVNRTAMTVSEAYRSYKLRFENGDRRIYSLYLRCKTKIDEAVEVFYPATWGERIAYVDEVRRVDQCL